MNEIEMTNLIIASIIDAIATGYIMNANDFALSIDIESQCEIIFDDDDADIAIPVYIKSRDKAIALINHAFANMR
jgi:hypothetical protein